MGVVGWAAGWALERRVVRDAVRLLVPFAALAGFALADRVALVFVVAFLTDLLAAFFVPAIPWLLTNRALP